MIDIDIDIEILYNHNTVQLNTNTCLIFCIIRILKNNIHIYFDCLTSHECCVCEYAAQCKWKVVHHFDGLFSPIEKLGDVFEYLSLLLQGEPSQHCAQYDGVKVHIEFDETEQLQLVRLGLLSAKASFPVLVAGLCNLCFNHDSWSDRVFLLRPPCSSVKIHKIRYISPFLEVLACFSLHENCILRSVMKGSEVDPDHHLWKETLEPRPIKNPTCFKCACFQTFRSSGSWLHMHWLGSDY